MVKIIINGGGINKSYWWKCFYKDMEINVRCMKNLYVEFIIDNL